MDDIHREKAAMEAAIVIGVIARTIVDVPDKVNVNWVHGPQTTVINLIVAPEDVGKVIGKQGRTAQSLRTVLNAVAAKQRLRAVLEIIEP